METKRSEKSNWVQERWNLKERNTVYSVKNCCKHGVCADVGWPRPSSVSPLLSPPQPHFPFILLSPRSFVCIRWPLRWLVSVLCTEGLALSPVYIKAVFTGLITRIRPPFLLCGGCRLESSVATVSVSFCGLSLASIWQQQPTVSAERGSGLRAQSKASFCLGRYCCSA